MEEKGESSNAANVEEDTQVDCNWKEEFANALIYCRKMLENENIISKSPPNKISSISMAIGDEIFKNIMEMMVERTIVIEENLIASNEIIENEDYEECTDENESPEFESPEFEDEEESSYEHIPLEYKEKTVALAEAHPKWTLKTLQRHGCSRLKSMARLYEWKKDVKRGGTKQDKWKLIETETFERFLEARESLEQVTTRTLQQWAMIAASPFLSETFAFVASKSWSIKFKHKYRIKQRKITRYVSRTDYALLEATMDAAERFWTQTRAIIPDFDLDFVINTDQTGCQYQMTYNRTLSEQGAKTVIVKKSHLNSLTHSYTAQYALTASGKIIPFVFLCLQEPTGKFGPLVQKNVDKLTDNFKNVFVTCSKSGKLTKEIYTKFLISVLSRYVNKQKFLLIIDSWGGQTDPILYDDIFQDEAGRASCNIKIISPKCTPICQPCDVYFYRQVKNFIKRVQNSPALLQEKREICSREDAIKIHSLLLHQLSAPAFIPMIQYAWYASKLITDKKKFLNMNEICFSFTMINKYCNCKNVAFIKCAWCNELLCFTCFYDVYHPTTCKPVVEEFPESNA